VRKKIASALLLSTHFAYCNLIIPQLFVIGGLASIPIIVTVVTVEALALYYFLKNISIIRSLAISCVGNIASSLVGSISMSVMTMPLFILNIHYTKQVITMFILMCLGSYLIELFAINTYFRYSFKQLWIPVLIGNALTYILLLIFPLRQYVFELLQYFFN